MLPLTLFRLSDNKGYGNYLKRTRETTISVGEFDYWEKAIYWCNRKAFYLNNCFSDKFLKLKNSFTLFNFKANLNLDEMLSLFLKDPIIPIDKFYSSMNIGLNVFQDLVGILLGANSTPKCTTRKIKQPCVMLQIRLLAA
jgi:hypothetical protein